MPLEQPHAIAWPEHERGRGERIGHHRTFSHDRGTGQASSLVTRSRVQDVVQSSLPALVVTGRAHSPIAYTDPRDDRRIESRVADAHRPRLTVAS